MAIVQIYTDDFNRADTGDGGAGGGWIDSLSSGSISGNRLICKAYRNDPNFYVPGHTGQIFSRPSAEASVYNKIQFDFKPNGWAAGTFVRLNGYGSETATGIYFLVWVNDTPSANSHYVGVWSVVDGTYTNLYYDLHAMTSGVDHTATIEITGSNPAVFTAEIKRTSTGTVVYTSTINLSTASYPAHQGSGTVGFVGWIGDAYFTDGYDNVTIWSDVTPIAPSAPTIDQISRPSIPLDNALLTIVRAMPEKGWQSVSANAWGSVWTPSGKRQSSIGYSDAIHTIIAAWSAFAWDSLRNKLILFGGGHANYNGNDVYAWDSATLNWERGSLPSKVHEFGSTQDYITDSNAAEPISSHCYDNSLYLSISDRFLTFGGASFNLGSPFTRETGGGSSHVGTGPYFLNTALLNGNNVGGADGTGVDAGDSGNNMWQNRDIFLNISATCTTSFVAGSTHPVVESGKDVVYSQKADGLWKYTVNSVSNLTTDTFVQVGAASIGNAGGAAAYNPVSKKFVRTGTYTGKTIQYWDLSGSVGGSNPILDAALTNNTSGNVASTNIMLFGNDFDPVRRRFLLWAGGDFTYALHEPQADSASTWVLDIDNPTETAGPGGGVANKTSGIADTGIFGKWKYMPNMDAFIGINNIDGSIWVYKPAQWLDPAQVANTDTITLTAPSFSATYPLGGYNLYKATSSGGLATAAVAATIGATGAVFAHSRAKLGATHYYEVRAIDNQGTPLESTASNIISSAGVIPALSQRRSSSSFGARTGTRQAN